MAVEQIKSNKGSKTKGTDGKIITDILDDMDGTYENIKRRLLGNYKPKLVKRVMIPKANGKLRPLGIPTIEDRVIQQMFKQVLEPICEKKFHPNSFGFRPNRSAENAIACNSSFINIGKLYYTVDLDIKGFFDNINHKKLIKQLWDIGIQDKTVLCIIKKMLNTEIIHPDKNREMMTKGTPQGGILSPLLANICLNELDWWLDSQWVGMKLKYTHTTLSAKYGAMKRTSLREVKFVRYADDFKLLCRTKKDAEIYYKLVKKFLQERLKLEISDEKSRVINIRRSSSEFLGFKINAKKRKTKKTEYVAFLHIKESAQKRIHENLKEIIFKISRADSINKRIKQAERFNSTVIGVHNYYRIATHCSVDFSNIGYKLNKYLLIKLGKPRNLKDERYKRYFKGYKMRVWDVNGISLFTVDVCKTRNPKIYSSKNKIKTTEKEDIELDNKILHDRIIYSEDPNWEKIRAEIHFLNKGKCAVSGKYLRYNEFSVHHIIPIENGGTDEKGNLILLDTNIHKELHKAMPNEELLKNQKFKELRDKIQNYKLIRQ